MAVKKTTRIPGKPEPIDNCGITPQPGASQGFYWRAAYAFNRLPEHGAPPRLKLIKGISDELVPGWFEWHSWTEKMIKAVAHNRWVAVAGCSSAGKTRNLAGFACTWWLCRPDESSVIFCSTTKSALRRRGWAEVQDYYANLKNPRPGNMVDSRMVWQAEKGDDKHAIIGIAVEEGSTTKIADNIKGHHTLRQMVIIDEATAVPPAIFDACSNLYAYPLSVQFGEFILVMMGNPRSRLDEFGKFMEPKGGWNTVSVDDDEWETKPQLDGTTGICVHFDAEKSPNIVEGKIVSRHLPTKERVEQKRKKLGSDNDPKYWSNERGFPPPEGLTKTVLSESVLLKHKAYDRHTFTGNRFSIIGALDPARTGDRIMLRFAKMGEIVGGEWGLELMSQIPIKINAKSSTPISYQIVKQVREQCQNVEHGGRKFPCHPSCFGVDATGGGADLCDLIQREWSPEVIRIQFGSSASESPCNYEDERPACSVYKNKRAEMYHRTRDAVKSEQLKGMDKETAKELCSLEYDDSKPLIVMQEKEDYRAIYGESPDLADVTVEIVEVARIKGFTLAAVGKTVEAAVVESREAQKTQAVYDEESAYVEENPQAYEPEVVEDLV